MKLFTALVENRIQGGLEVTSQAVRFAFIRGDTMERIAERLPPGVVDQAGVHDYGRLVAALQSVRAAFAKRERRRDRKKPVNVVLTVGSFANVYSRTFTLPAIDETRLDDAVALNLQMIAPSDLGGLYAGWELVSREETTGRVEVMAAFIERKLLDDLARALEEAGFFAVVAEFKALALTRLLRERGAGVDPGKSYVCMALDASGLDFLIMRHGELQFEYFTPWKDIQGEGREIPLPAFQEAIKRSLNQVATFYSQHWQDKLSEVLVSAGEITEEVLRIVKESFFAPARELQLRVNEPISWEWLVSVSGAIRAGTPRTSDEELNFLGKEVAQEFHRRHVLGFLGFWRTMMPAAAVLLVGALLTTSVFLREARMALEAETTPREGEIETKKVEALRQQVELFNTAVRFVASARGGVHPKSTALRRLDEIFTRHDISVNRLKLQEDAPVLLSGEAKTEGKIRDFKNALEGDPHFANVILPLHEIKVVSQQKLSFSITFSAISENIE